MGRDIRLGRRTRQREQRANEPAARAWHAGEPSRAGAADDPHQHGLGLIARGVAEQHRDQVVRGDRRLERGVTRVAGGRLERRPPLHDDAPHVDTRTALACPRGDAGRGRAAARLELVIDRDHDDAARRAGERGGGERHRIGAAGAGHADRSGW